MKKMAKEFSVEWEELKNRRSEIRDKTMFKRYASPTSKIHVSRNGKTLVFSIRRFTELGREITKGSIKIKYFQKSFQNRFRGLN